MRKKDELRAAELLEEYVQDARHGQQHNIEACLERCPPSEVERLRLAVEGVDFALQEYAWACVKESTLQRTWEQVQEIQRKRRALAEMRTRAQTNAHVPPDDPGSYLARILGAPIPALAIQSVPQKARAHPELEPWDPKAGRSSGEISLREREGQLQVVESEIAQQTEEILAGLRINMPPIDMNAVAEHFTLFVQEAPLAGVDGCLVTHNEVGAIALNSKATTQQRKRFTLAHETGHYVRHRHLRMQFRDTLGEWGSYLYDQEEFEADTFAAMLLMPAALLPANFGSEQPSLKQAEDLAQRFDVSLAAALRRLVRASHWRCALAIIVDGVIECWTRSPELNGYARKGQSASPVSIAAHLALSEKLQEAAVTLPAAEWFGGPVADEGALVWEQSRRVSNGEVYALITVIEPE